MGMAAVGSDDEDLDAAVDQAPDEAMQGQRRAVGDAHVVTRSQDQAPEVPKTSRRCHTELRWDPAHPHPVFKFHTRELSPGLTNVRTAVVPSSRGEI